MRREWLLVIPASAVAAALSIACVGDDPSNTTTPIADGGGTETSVENDTGTGGNDAGTEASAQIAFSDVSGGEGFACAVRVDGSVVCWGSTALGVGGQSTGGGTTCNGAPCTLPTVVPGITDAVKIASGPNQSCVVTKAGKVSCWGANDDGVLGRPINSEADCGGGHTCTPTPKEVAGVADATGVAVTRSSACAWNAAGAVTCWGHNRVGGLARGTHTDEVLAPGAASALTGSGAALLAGNLHLISHWCAARIDGTVSCWGRNAVGEVGTPAVSTPYCPFSGFLPDTGTACIAAPHTVAADAGGGGANDITPVASIAATDGATCVSAGGTVYCWGGTHHGIPAAPGGSGSERPPTVRTAAGGLSALSGTYVHVCGITGTGDVKCWGENNFGNLGVQLAAANETCANGPCLSTPTPVTLPAGVKAKKVVAAAYTSYVLTPEGRIFAWGLNNRGQLGHLPRPTENACAQSCNALAEEVLVP